jgi:nucleoside-diphosphate-sugar epimerase
MALHTILGANGTIATELLPVLLENKEQIRLVSRKPKAIAGTTTMATNLLNRDETVKAVEGSSIVYLLVGIEYNHKVWQRDWPVIMQNVMDACKAAKAKLIFFDNVYPYGTPATPVTEATPFNPCSKKGAIRAAVDNMLLNEMKNGMLDAIITRAADFYGPRVTDKSAANVLVFSRMKKKQRAQWFVNPHVKRTYSYTPDCAKAIYILSKHPEAFNQTWILPAVFPAFTGKEFIALAAREMNASAKVQVIPKWIVKMIGWFNPFIREMYEMLYQDEFGYQLDSSRFEKAFNFTPTSYEEGIKATAQWVLENE